MRNTAQHIYIYTQTHRHPHRVSPHLTTSICSITLRETGQNQFYHKPIDINKS